MVAYRPASDSSFELKLAGSTGFRNDVTRVPRDVWRWTPPRSARGIPPASFRRARVGMAAVPRPRRVGIISGGGIEAAPDLIVEILSDSTPQTDRGPKLLQYTRFRVQLYWIADPEAAHIEVHRLLESPTEPTSCTPAARSGVHRVLSRKSVLSMDDPTATEDDLSDVLPVHLFDLTAAEGKPLQPLCRGKDASTHRSAARGLSLAMYSACSYTRRMASGDQTTLICAAGIGSAASPTHARYPLLRRSVAAPAT
jgi:hypothetical protein